MKNLGGRGGAVVIGGHNLPSPGWNRVNCYIIRNIGNLITFFPFFSSYSSEWGKRIQTGCGWRIDEKNVYAKSDGQVFWWCQWYVINLCISCPSRKVLQWAIFIKQNWADLCNYLVRFRLIKEAKKTKISGISSPKLSLILCRTGNTADFVSFAGNSPETRRSGNRPQGMYIVLFYKLSIYENYCPMNWIGQMTIHFLLIKPKKFAKKKTRYRI